MYYTFQRDNRKPEPSATPEKLTAPEISYEYNFPDDVAAWLILGGVVILVATIAEDFATMGVGVADDGWTIPLALSMIARGASLVGA